MPASNELKSLVNRMPDPDDRQMFTKNIDANSIESAIAEIHQGGRENILGLIDLLDKPGSAADVKPHYALRCLANAVLKRKDDKARSALVATFATALQGQHPKHVKAFLCQELQWAGNGDAVPALGSLLLDEELVEPAAMALVAIGANAADQFRAALPKASGKCRLNILHGLAALGDAASAPAFRQAIHEPDREMRLTACWGLARLGQASDVGLLLNAADAATGWERIQATNQCLVLAESLVRAGRATEAAGIYKYLRDTRTDPSEAHVQAAAARGLAGPNA